MIYLENIKIGIVTARIIAAVIVLTFIISTNLKKVSAKLWAANGASHGERKANFSARQSDGLWYCTPIYTL